MLPSPASPNTSGAVDTLAPFDWPFTLGFWVADWMHTHLIQPNGPHAGRPFNPTPRQRRFLLWWYAFDEDGQWLYQHGVRRLAKGSGKSPFAAALALAEFCGPVRIDRIDNDDVRLWKLGRCRPKPVDMPLVQIAATAESQTANTMRMVRAFAPKKSDLTAKYQLDVGKTRYYKPPEGTLEVITASFTAAEGAESSFVVADETEHWKPTNGGPDLASTLHDNLAKSGSRLLETSNAWVPGQQSVAETTWDAWVAQEEGRTHERGILYDAVMAPPDTDISDPDSLRAGLSVVFEDCWWQELGPIEKRIRSLAARPDESKRKYLNWPTTDEDAWISAEEWALLANPEREVKRGEKIVAFFDGSTTGDATALVGTCVSDGHVFLIGLWEPTKARAVDTQDVDRVVDEMFDTWQVVGFFGDVWQWESFVKLAWPERYKQQLRLMSIPGGKDPQWIAWDMRGHTYDFTQATELVEAEIRDRTFGHDGDSRLARHVTNCRRRMNRYGITVGKESAASPKKIDAAVCMIGARMVRRLYLAAGVDEPETFVPRRVR